MIIFKGKSKLQPIIDISNCVVCEICAEVCPDVFKLNTSGFIEVLELEHYPKECVMEAVKYCPEDCISLQ
jgi:ferredoxin